ncbi:Helix-turn-helix [Pedobacter sp. ok626]|uniref:helix-turn-helix domain-containing protein n=1 Tax=Pedobacter sp. ok626 TaxID=1761882 RepID=UPI00088EF11E|nr:helix-turn-helix transcriptional regulator [Pedobacter sp. ok626]SDK00035.1 Helix-turn-helix [Pedobacter sp. ok626]
MDIQIGLKKILKKGFLSSELDFERASIIDRKLRVLIKEHPELTKERDRLRDILVAYEDKHWVNAEITEQQVEESDLAEQIAECENKFNLSRKQSIKAKLKEKGLTQKQLGIILGHTSETYISELINGINPFTLNDLILIHKLLGISMEQLVPTTLNAQTIIKVKNAVVKLNNPKLQIKIEDLVEV